MEQPLSELIELIKEASPAVWAIVLKQIYIEATVKAVWSGICFLISLLCGGLIFYCWKKYNDAIHDDEEGWIMGASFSACGALVALIIFIALLTSAIKWFSNPEFYALQYLLSQLH